MYLLCLQKYTQIEARRPRLMKKQVAEEVLILQEVELEWCQPTSSQSVPQRLQDCVLCGHT